MKVNTHSLCLCTANLLQSFWNPEKQIIRPSPLATPQPPHPPKAPEAASRRSCHGCGATPPRGCHVHHAGRATRHWELAATQWTEFESNLQSSTSPTGESCARLPAGLRPHRHLWCNCQSTWNAQKGIVGIKGRQSVAVPLASDFCKSDHLQLSISHFWPFNVANCCQRNSRDNGPNSRKKTRRLTNWPNIATKFARRGTFRSLLLSNWSSWHPAASATQWMECDSNYQSATSAGESSARLPSGLRPHRHLWCLRQSTWSDQKGALGAAPLASHFCKSDHLQLSISHFWPFNVANCCQRNSRDNGPNMRKKHGV